MDAMIFPHPTPFTMMASADYSPYPLHTAHRSSPRQRRIAQSAPTASTRAYTGATPPRRKELYIRNHYTPITPRPALKHSSTTSRCQLPPSPKPKPVRVDSGFDETASTTSSITFTEEVERRFALQQCLRQYHHSSSPSVTEDENEDEDGEHIEEDEGALGKMARDSIDINIFRARTWGSKEIRSKRDHKCKVKMVKRWVGRLFGHEMKSKNLMTMTV
jgi:hypothetical protein